MRSDEKMRRNGEDDGGSNWSPSAELILGAFAKAGPAGLPLYQRLRGAISELINEDKLVEGMQLPPEKWLAAELGMSLGTVQKALATLDAEGRIKRRHGHGNFVARERRPLTELWHFRFIDPDTGELLPVYSHLLSRRVVKSADPADAILGRDPAGFVEIERLIDIAGHFKCYSRMYLPATIFHDLLNIDKDVFDDVNLKTIFSSKYGKPTLGVVQRVGMITPPNSVAKHIGVSNNQPTIVLKIVASSDDGRPFSFQSIFIPMSRFDLDLPFPGALAR